MEFFCYHRDRPGSGALRDELLEEKPMLDRAGFDIEEAVHSEDGIFARYLLRAC